MLCISKAIEANPSCVHYDSQPLKPPASSLNDGECLCLVCITKHVMEAVSSHTAHSACYTLHWLDLEEEDLWI